MEGTNYVLPSLCVSLNIGHADLLDRAPDSVTADATLCVSNIPSTETTGQSLMDLFRCIEFTNFYQQPVIDNSYKDLDGVMFRIHQTHYTTLQSHVNTIFTPSFASTDAHLINNVSDQKIRYLLPVDASVNTNQTVFRVTQMTDAGIETIVGGSPAPGDFNNSTHGCLGDVHIGYLSAALTGTHRGRAIVNNEDVIIDTLAYNSCSLSSDVSNISFGEAVMRALFPTQDLSGDGYYYESMLSQTSDDDNTTKPIKELFSQLYHKSTERFYGYYTSLTEPSVVQTVYEHSETLTLRSDLSFNTHGIIVYDGSDTIVPLLDVEGTSIASGTDASFLPVTDLYQPLPFHMGDSVSFKITFNGSLQLLFANDDITETKGNQLLTMYSTHAQNIPATYTYPIDPSLIEYNTHLSRSSVNIRDQVYQLKIVLDGSSSVVYSSSSTTDTVVTNPSTADPAPSGIYDIPLENVDPLPLTADIGGELLDGNTYQVTAVEHASIDGMYIFPIKYNDILHMVAIDSNKERDNYLRVGARGGANVVYPPSNQNANVYDSSAITDAWTTANRRSHNVNQMGSREDIEYTNTKLSISNVYWSDVQKIQTPFILDRENYKINASVEGTAINGRLTTDLIDASGLWIFAVQDGPYVKMIEIDEENGRVDGRFENETLANLNNSELYTLYTSLSGGNTLYRHESYMITDIRYVKQLQIKADLSGSGLTSSHIDIVGLKHPAHIDLYVFYIQEDTNVIMIGITADQDHLNYLRIDARVATASLSSMVDTEKHTLWTNSNRYGGTNNIWYEYEHTQSVYGIHNVRFVQENTVFSTLHHTDFENHTVTATISGVAIGSIEDDVVAQQYAGTTDYIFAITEGIYLKMIKVNNEEGIVDTLFLVITSQNANNSLSTNWDLAENVDYLGDDIFDKIRFEAYGISNVVES